MAEDLEMRRTFGWGVGAATTTYAIKNGLVALGAQLSFIDDPEFSSAPATTRLAAAGIYTPPGFEIVGALSGDAMNGAQGFAAYNATSNTAIIGVSGIDGFVRDVQDTASGVLYRGLNQAVFLSYGNAGFGVGLLEALRRSIVASGNSPAETHFVIGGQSMGGAIAHFIRAEIRYGKISPFRDLPDGQITLVSINGLGVGDVMSHPSYPLASDRDRLYNSTDSIINGYVANDVPDGNTGQKADLVSRLGGVSPGTYVRLAPVNHLAQKMGSMHRIAFQFLTSLKDNYGGDYRQARQVQPDWLPTEQYYGLGRLLFGDGAVINNAQASISLFASGIANVAVSSPGDSGKAMGEFFESIGWPPWLSRALGYALEVGAKYGFFSLLTGDVVGFAKAALTLLIGTRAASLLRPTDDGVPDPVAIPESAWAFAGNQPVDAERGRLASPDLSRLVVIDRFENRIEMSANDGTRVTTWKNGTSYYQSAPSGGMDMYMFSDGKGFIRLDRSDASAWSPLGENQYGSVKEDGAAVVTTIETDVSGIPFQTVTERTYNPDGTWTEAKYINGDYLSVSSGIWKTSAVPTDQLAVRVENRGVLGGNQALDMEELASHVMEGYLVRTPTKAVSMPVSYVDGNGYWLTEPASIVSDGFRPGNLNLTAPGVDARVGEAIRPLWGSSSLESVFTAVNLNAATRSGNESIYVDPLVLDLDGDGVSLSSYAERPVLFDIDNDGRLERTGWVSAADGILVLDRNGNGRIDDVSETLSEYFGGVRASGGGSMPFGNGFDALRSLDTSAADGSLRFSVADTAWSRLRVWVDGNGNGASEVAELRTLDSLGITWIDLTASSESGLLRDGNEIVASGRFEQKIGTNGLGSAMGSQRVIREALSVDFLADPAGHSITSQGGGSRILTEGGVTAYVVQGDAGQRAEVTLLQVRNAYGGRGNDTLVGDAGRNWLGGGPGSDQMSGGAGDDVLLVDAADRPADIRAGDGMDILKVVGDAGVSLDLAELSVETAEGGRGDDLLVGGGVTSVYVRGGPGDDVLVGGAASDALSGNIGDDRLEGGGGNDLLRGHMGLDTIRGGAGSDIIDGGLDDDQLAGDEGDDALTGGAGSDFIDGGAGVDVVEYAGSYADYRISRSGEVVVISDLVHGRDGTDRLTGVEKASFRDLALVEFGTQDNPLPVNDALRVDASGQPWTRAGVRTIARQQLLGNDIDYQGDALSIAAVSNPRGGTVSISAAGDVLFTPDPAYSGLMSFDYSIRDARNNPAAVVTEIGGTQSAPMRGRVALHTADLPTDPGLGDQWYLDEIRVFGAWQNYSGRGVRIGQFEPPSPFGLGPEVFDFRHPDLQANVDRQWLADPEPGRRAGEGSEDNFSAHATLVAGVMAAARDGQGIVGVAPGATLAGHSLPSKLEEPTWLRRMGWYDVANHSWVLSSDIQAFVAVSADLMECYTTAAMRGRDGRGTIIVTGSGNDRLTGGNASQSWTTSNRFTITTGAVNAPTDLGLLTMGSAPFGNPGANILVSAPASDISSTSRLVQNEDGSVLGGSTETAEGTSFATPIVSAVAALMLEANPFLGARDVQQILALTARRVEDPSTRWDYNRGTHWNGGGLHVSHDYGFGTVDALAATRLAEDWPLVSTFGNEANSATPFRSPIMNTAIPDNDTVTGLTSSIRVSGLDGLQLEHVEVSVDLTHARAGDLILKLVSPSGTESILMNRPGKAPGSGPTDRGAVTFVTDNRLLQTFTTVRSWDERINGNWTLRVQDAATGDVGTLGSWSIDFFGRAPGYTEVLDDHYIYTGEYPAVSATPGRNQLRDVDGGVDLINLSAVDGPVNVNLGTGVANVAGAALSIVDPAGIEHVIGGGLADVLTGGAATNFLVGGRGNDRLSGASGADVLLGGADDDTLSGGSEFDAFVIGRNPGDVDRIVDFEPNLDRIVLSGFGDSSATDHPMLQAGSDVSIDLGNGQTLMVSNVTLAAMSPGQFLTTESPLRVSDLFLSESFWFGADGYDGPIKWVGGDVSAWGGANLSGPRWVFETFFGGAGQDRIHGGPGDDHIVGENSAVSSNGGHDVIFGESGSDVLQGSGGDDTLSGGRGSDRLEGGNGDDQLLLQGDEAASILWTVSGNASVTGMLVIGQPLTDDALGTMVWTDRLTLGGDSGGYAVSGGPGADRFVVEEDLRPGSQEASGGALRNLIEDFQPLVAGECIDLSRVRAVDGFSDLHFSSLTFTDAAGTANYIRIWLGPPGIGTQYVTLAGITPAQLQPGHFLFQDGRVQRPLVPRETVIGTDADDPATVLRGDAGGNRIDGGPGADTMQGRTGDDTYLVDNPGDQVVEVDNGGFDTIRASVATRLPEHVEALLLTGGLPVAGRGNALHNRITGNDAANFLDGGRGADTLRGGRGNDTYVVDDGFDSVSEDAAGGVDTVRASVSYALGRHQENLSLTGSADVDGSGNELANAITGNSGANRLDGGTGADTLTGGAGNDVYLVDAAGDRVVELSGEGRDEVYSGVSTLLWSQVDDLTLTGVAALGATGNELPNRISGNLGNNLMTGGAGDDTLDGQAGSDTLQGGEGNDRYFVDGTDLVQESSGQGVDEIVSSVSSGLPGFVENLTLRGGAAANGSGNSSPNRLTGNSAPNRLEAGEGNDTLDGGGGADTLSGGNGDDLFVVDHLNESIIEASGQGLDSMQSSVTWDLNRTPQVENLTLLGTANLGGTGNLLPNRLTGNAGPNTLSGGAGHDTLSGAAGVDTLSGGDGDDVYEVGSDTDIVVEVAGGGLDVVRSDATFTLATLGAVENLELLGNAPASGTGNALSNVLTGNTGRNALQGGDGNDRLTGDPAGNPGHGGLRSLSIWARGRPGGEVNPVLKVRIDGVLVADRIEVDTATAVPYQVNLPVGMTTARRVDVAYVNEAVAGGSERTVWIERLTVNGLDLSATEDVMPFDAGLDDAAFDGLGMSLTSGGTMSVNGSVRFNLDGSDRLDGGRGADTMAGGLGDDLYLVDDPGDNIIEEAGSGCDVLRSSISWDLALQGSQVEFLQLAGTATLSGWGNSLANVLYGNTSANRLDGREGNDSIRGGGGADTLRGGLGNDALYGEIGGDTYEIAPGEGVDLVYDTDSTPGVLDVVRVSGVVPSAVTLYRDRTAVAGLQIGIDAAGTRLTVANWFSSPAQRVEQVLFDDGTRWDETVLASAPINGSSGNDTLTGMACPDVMLGQAGHDRLGGLAGADTLVGGGGNDTLLGDAGGDLYVLARGHGQDSITDTDTTVGPVDTLSYEPGVLPSQLWFRQVGQGLEISVIGTADRAMLDWYTPAAGRVEQIRAGGMVLVDTAVQNLVDAMATFAPPALGQTTLSPGYQSALNPVIAANWQ